MKYLFVLSKEDIGIAKEEVLALVSCIDNKLIDNYLILNRKIKISNNILKRLAYTKKVYRVLFIPKSKKDYDNFDWQRYYKNSFSVRAYGELRKKEQDFANLIYYRLSDPLVDLKDAKTKFGFYKIKNKIYVCKLLNENDEDFQSRRSHLRPKSSGTSMHPKLARACVNLTGIKRGYLVDCFCGNGGILIEAGLMCLSPIGYDIDDTSIKKAKINLDHYKIRFYKLLKKDAVELKRTIRYLATDMPYGKSSKMSDELDKLYSGFFNNLRHILQKKAVVIFPHYVDHKKYLKDFNIVDVFRKYIHKSLTKVIVIIEPKRKRTIFK